MNMINILLHLFGWQGTGKPLKLTSKLRFIPIIAWLLLAGKGIAQNIEESNHDHHPGHEHHNNEIGVVAAPVYFLKTKDFNFGLHLHYLRGIGESKFGIGAGYERIFGDHGHHFLGIVGAYRPTNAFSLMFSPGLAYEDAKRDGPEFGLHIEAVYEFEFRGIHIGSVLEFSYDADDIHVSPGLHIGIGF